MLAGIPSFPSQNGTDDPLTVLLPIGSLNYLLQRRLTLSSEDQTSENRFAFRETPTYGQFMALQMYVGILSGYLYHHNPEKMEEVAETVEKIANMDKSQWSLSPEQLEEFHIAWETVKAGIYGKFPLF